MLSLNTATDSVNDETAATSTSMLDPAATDNSSNASDAQAASGGSNADDSSADAQDSNIKDSSSKATNNVNATTQSDQQADSKKKYKQPQQPNPIKAQLSRFGQYIKASAVPILTSKFVQLLISAAVALHKLWKKRPKCPYTLYVVVMALIDAAAVTFIQWGMYSEPKYDDPNAVDNTTKILNSVNGQVTRFVTQMWLEEDKLNWLLNFLALGMVYLVLVFVINRFWVATAVFAITMSVYAVANSIKIILRNEPILPSDLSFLSSGNGGKSPHSFPKAARHW
ncbi:Phosphoglycerol transferase [Bifidobacterium longum subsp. longum]|nr:Phosphoglycerol transferase [Bifidobacterium longum subsp. longum]